jgi:predicted alpha/beta-fold hydrolase
MTTVAMKSLKIKCDGYSVDADWYEGKSTNNILLSLIGWTSNRKRYSEILTAIVAGTGMSALVFEYTGHGESSFDINKTRPAQHFLEVIHVFDWVKEKYPEAKITVMGSSYGSYLAAQLTQYRKFDRLILRVPAIYKPEDFYTLNGIINSDEGWSAKDGYRRNVGELSKHPFLTQAANYGGKTLVVVHDKDEQVPKTTTDAYIKAFKSDVYIAKGFPHYMGDMPHEQIVKYQNAIIDWLK